MLEYVKQVLQKVSFDLNLFEKELRKCLTYLIDDELKEFTRWCYDNFNSMPYKAILQKYLSSTAR